MANDFIKATQVAQQALGLLEREVVLPRVVTRDAGDDFVGAQGDTVSIRVPAYMAARTRTLRNGTPITVDELHETKVDVTLDTDIYKAVGVSDEEMTLDIGNFGTQVTSPMVSAVARGVEDDLAATISGAPYATEIEIDNTDPFLSLLDANVALNKANVPFGGRTLLVGADFERKLLGSDRFTAQIGGESTATGAMRDATIGEQIAGFRIVRSNAISPEQGVAFHSTAFALAMRAPMVPDGAAWGTTSTFNGMSMRILRDYDFLNVRDRVLANVFIGSNYITDTGIIDADGRFVPDPLGQGETITLATSAAADDVIDTTTPHGFVEGQAVTFPTLTGGTGLTAANTYYVIAANLAPTRLQVSETPGGTAVDFTTDITAGTVERQQVLVRAVKLVDDA